MTVLCYHAVDPSWESPLAVAPDTFESHCRWIMSRRRVVALDAAIDRFDARFRLPRGDAAITFDDGFESLHSYALPILHRLDLRATVFVVAQTLAPGGKVVDWIDPAPAVPPATLTQDQILELEEAGINIESHSWSHRDLPSLTEAECYRDLRESRTLLEEILRRPVRFLAYPRGRHAPHVRSAARRAGYSLSFSLPERRETAETHAVPRVGVYRGNTVASIAIKAQPMYLAVRTSAAYSALQRKRS